MLVATTNSFQLDSHQTLVRTLKTASILVLSISSCVKAALGFIALVGSLGFYKPLWNFGCRQLKDAQNCIVFSTLLFLFPSKIYKNQHKQTLHERALNENALISIFFQIERAQKQMEQELQKSTKRVVREKPLTDIELAPLEIGDSYFLRFAHHMGAKKKNEDFSIFSFLKLKMKNQVTYGHTFCLFDGHAGTCAAKYLMNKISGELEKQLVRYNFSAFTAFGVYKALHQTFFKLKKEFKKENPNSKAGTTALVCLIIKNYLFVANVGDSRAAAWDGDKVIRLTEDALPQLPHYKKRIEKLGGEVVEKRKQIKTDKGQATKITYRIGGRLSPGRAFGDLDIKGVSTKPQITLFNLANFKKGSFIVLASDGIWDVCGTKHVVDLIKQFPKDEASWYVIQNAWLRGSGDNMSAITVFLN